MHYLSKFLNPSTEYQLLYYNLIKLSLFFYLGILVSKNLTLLEGDNDSPLIDRLLKILNWGFFGFLIGYIILKWVKI